MREQRPVAAVSAGRARAIRDDLSRQSPAGMAHASPGAHGKLSQHAVAEDRRIAFAIARKGDDAPRKNGSFFVVAGEAELAADFIKGNRHRLDFARTENLQSEKLRHGHCFLSGR